MARRPAPVGHDTTEHDTTEHDNSQTDKRRRIDGHNKVDLRGQVTGEPQLRKFDSGAELFTFNVRVPGRPGRFTSVPVSVWDGDAAATGVAEGDVVRVRGSVVRRFWADPSGGRRSVVEVVADEVGPGGRPRRS